MQELPASGVVGDAARGCIRSVRALSSAKSHAPSSVYFCNFLLRSYGPFNYAGAFTTESNRRFDGWLKGRNAASGIRDFEAVRDVAGEVKGSVLVPVLIPVSCVC